MSTLDASRPRTGWVDDDVATTFPGLGLHWARVPVSFLRGPRRQARAHLRDLSASHRTGPAVLDGLDDAARAHEIFFRRIGKDPKLPPRPPAQAMMTARLLRGEFKSTSFIDDAILIALIETGIGVTALDAGAFAGSLGIREAREGESLQRADGVAPLTTGRLVIVADGTPVAEVFGAVASSWNTAKATAEVVLFAVRPPGVTGIVADEAVWTARTILVGPSLAPPRGGQA